MSSIWTICPTCKQEYFSGGIHHCKAEDVAKLLLPRIEKLEALTLDLTTQNAVLSKRQSELENLFAALEGKFR